MIAAMEITDETPMTMPNTVRAERTLDERSVSMAAKKFSRACASVMIVISRTSRQPRGRAVTLAPLDKFQKIAPLWNSGSRPESPPKFERKPEKACTSEIGRAHV